MARSLSCMADDSLCYYFGGSTYCYSTANQNKGGYSSFKHAGDALDFWVDNNFQAIHSISPQAQAPPWHYISIKGKQTAQFDIDRLFPDTLIPELPFLYAPPIQAADSWMLKGVEYNSESGVVSLGIINVPYDSADNLKFSTLKINNLNNPGYLQRNYFSWCKHRENILVSDPTSENLFVVKLDQGHSFDTINLTAPFVFTRQKPVSDKLDMNEIVDMIQYHVYAMQVGLINDSIAYRVVNRGDLKKEESPSNWDLLFYDIKNEVLIGHERFHKAKYLPKIYFNGDSSFYVQVSQDRNSTDTIRFQQFKLRY